MNTEDLSIDDLLKDDAEDSFFPGAEDKDPPKDQKQDEGKDDVKAELERVQRELAELKNRRPDPVIPQGHSEPARQPTAADREAYEKELEATFLASPGKFLANLESFIDQKAERKAREVFIPAARNSTMARVDQHISRIRAAEEDTFEDAEDEFNEVLKEVKPDGLANLDDDTLKKSVDSLYELALGRAVRKRAVTGKRRTPPPYSTGSSGASGGSAARGKLSAEERLIVESMREYKMSDDDIKDALKRHREQ